MNTQHDEVRSDWRCRQGDTVLPSPAPCTAPLHLSPQAAAEPARFPELLLLEWALESPDFAELLKVVSEDTARNVFQCMPAKADSEVFG